jgi:lactoylglutathione lyase/methylmalonyl-CoA/ethylmalonyl-CoA epimerase
MKPKRIHHIGIVMPTEEYARDIMELFGMEEDHAGYVECYQTDVIFTKHGPNESPIEFIIPKGTSVLKDFNGGKGGIAHVCFEVDDCEATSKAMEAKGFKMLEAPKCQRSGLARKDGSDAHDLVINFLRPKYAHGVLFEFVQRINPK